MTIKEAMEARIPRVRLPNWSDPNAYLRLPLLKNGFHGPWAELYDPIGQEVLELPIGSQKILVIECGDDRYERYDGPAHQAEADNYAATYEDS